MILWQRHSFGAGKERDRDIESNYDYFGARYYDSRIANWTSIDPLFEKHFDYSPYTYVMRNPLALIDPDGMEGDPASMAFPQEASTSYIDKARDWSRKNRMLLSVTKRLPYVGPVIAFGDILLNLPEPKIPISNIAVIQEYTAKFISVDGIKEIIVETDRLYSKSLSDQQVREKIRKGQAPGSIDRLDKGNPENNEGPHLHFKKDKKGDHALFKTGIWKHGGRKLTNNEIDFIKKIGWKLPKE